MIIDSKGKLFGKLNIIDLCLVLAVIAVAVIVYIKMGDKTVVTDTTQEFTIGITCEEAPDYVQDYIKVGDTVVDDSKAVTLGKIVGVKFGPSINYGVDDRGYVAKSSKEGYCSVFLTISGKGQPFINGMVIDGNKYMVNHAFTVRAGSGKLWAKISGLDAKADDAK